MAVQRSSELLASSITYQNCWLTSSQIKFSSNSATRKFFTSVSAATSSVFSTYHSSSVPGGCYPSKSSRVSLNERMSFSIRQSFIPYNSFFFERTDNVGHTHLVSESYESHELHMLDRSFSTKSTLRGDRSSLLKQAPGGEQLRRLGSD